MYFLAEDAQKLESQRSRGLKTKRQRAGERERGDVRQIGLALHAAQGAAPYVSLLRPKSCLQWAQGDARDALPIRIKSTSLTQVQTQAPNIRWQLWTL